MYENIITNTVLVFIVFCVGGSETACSIFIEHQRTMLYANGNTVRILVMSTMNHTPYDHDIIFLEHVHIMYIAWQRYHNVLAKTGTE